MWRKTPATAPRPENERKLAFVSAEQKPKFRMDEPFILPEFYMSSDKSRRTVIGGGERTGAFLSAAQKGTERGCVVSTPAAGFSANGILRLPPFPGGTALPCTPGNLLSDRIQTGGNESGFRHLPHRPSGFKRDEIPLAQSLRPQRSRTFLSYPRPVFV